MANIRSISGLRATLGNDLTPELVARYVAAFSTMLPEGTIVVGNDGRPSGVWITNVVLGTLQACGRTIQHLGTVPTPTVQLITETTDAVGGLIITASHNPAEWNGLKFLSAAGVFLTAEENQRLWEVVDNSAQTYSSVQQHGSILYTIDAVEQHIQHVLHACNAGNAQATPETLVVVDAVNCSGSVIIPQLLERLGYKVLPLYCDSSGIFPHVPEPLAQNLGALCTAVVQHKAAFGVAVDPDADRLVLIDSTGTPIGEERTIALATEAVLMNAPNQKVVVNFSTSRMVNDVAERYSSTVVRAAVGEINVVQKMLLIQAIIGGEGSGGVIYPACHAGRDAVVGLALVCLLMLRTNTSLDECSQRIPSYSMIKHKIEVPSREFVPDFLENVHDVLKGAMATEIATEDGIFAAWPTHWVHVRASNTEPILRIISEAPTQEQAQELITLVQNLLP